MINKIKKLQESIKIKMKNETLLVEALTHKSSNNKFNNEKLEFIGDRVIGLVLSKKIYDLYPKDKEGILDKKFANLVKRKACCDVAWSINLQNFILMGDKKKKISINDEKILSDACEALVGAIFIDRGFDYAMKFVLNIWKNELVKSDVTILDSKTKLQEYSLKKHKKLPIYNLISSKGPKHKLLFKISVHITGSKKTTGYGKSIQLAEQDGAHKLLKEINIS